MTIIRTLRAAAASLLALVPALAAEAAEGRTTRIVLPVSAGSGVDTAVRAMRDALVRSLGGPVVIENIAGAGGLIGTQAIVNAPKDGATIGVVSNNHVVGPHVFKTIPYDPIADVTPITLIARTPFVVVARPDGGVATLKDLLAKAKAEPGKVTYGSSGAGTIVHFCGAALAAEAGLDLLHIPYRGLGPMTTDLLGGQIATGCLPGNVAAGHLAGGKLVALGVTTPERARILPNVPTMREQGLAGYEVEGWFAAVGPAGLPAAEVERINAAFRAALADPATAEAMDKQGHTVALSDPATALAYFKSELAKYGRLAKAAGITPQ